MQDISLFAAMDTLFIVGGYYEDSSHYYYLDTSEGLSLSDKPSSCPSSTSYPLPITKYVMAKSENDPVICGGVDTWERKTECYRYQSHSWSQFANLSTARDQYGLVQINDKDFWITGKFFQFLHQMHKKDRRKYLPLNPQVENPVPALASIQPRCLVLPAAPLRLGWNCRHLWLDIAWCL